MKGDRLEADCGNPLRFRVNKALDHTDRGKLEFFSLAQIFRLPFYEGISDGFPDLPYVVLSDAFLDSFLEEYLLILF
jgi:hypothetical protein